MQDWRAPLIESAEFSANFLHPMGLVQAKLLVPLIVAKFGYDAYYQLVRGYVQRACEPEKCLQGWRTRSAFKQRDVVTLQVCIERECLLRLLVLKAQ